MEMRLDRLKERLDLYEKLMRLDKPSNPSIPRGVYGLEIQCWQGFCNIRQTFA